MAVDLLESFVLQIAPQATAAAEPTYLAGYQRGVKIIDAPPRAQAAPLSLDAARELIKHELNEYAALVNPEHMLLVKAQPGVGKTHAAVRLAEKLAAQGRRVLYCAPRHDFITDLRAITATPSAIYEWLPRQAKSETKAETCLYTEKISTWMERGYDAIDFCSRICGWDYCNELCPYHVQKNRAELIIMGQHQHLFSGHPLDFAFVIGDESPLSAVLSPWVISGRWINPAGMDEREPLTEIMHELSKLADDRMTLSGPALLKALGGAEHVLGACTTFVLPAADTAVVPNLRNAADADLAPYFHLPKLLPLLQREAQAATDGREYPHRVIVENGNLMLLLRKSINDQMPRHIVWLDATGNQHLYRELFDRPVKVVEPNVAIAGRVVQVTDRANGKASLIKDGEPTGKVDQLNQQIAQIVSQHNLQRPGIVSFQALAAPVGVTNAANFLHFYGARGTNVQQEVDGLIVAGTPQPSQFDLEKQARMVFFDRMTAFNRQWSMRDVPYNYVAADDKGRTYTTSGFWHDEDLQALLWQNREAELIQAVHRSRLTVRDVTVWLLSNLPIWELPIAELLSIAELMAAPTGVDTYLWRKFVELAETMGQFEKARMIDIARDQLGMSKPTTLKYIDALLDIPGWQIAKIDSAPGKRGPKPALVSKETEIGKPT